VIGTNAFRDWRRPIGESGDLADVIAAILSLAAQISNETKIPMSKFYSGFASLAKQYPDLLPDVHTTNVGGIVHAPELSEALEGAQRIGVGISNPTFQNLFFLDMDRAQNVLGLIQKREGKEFIERLRPLAQTFAAYIK